MIRFRVCFALRFRRSHSHKAGKAPHSPQDLNYCAVVSSTGGTSIRV